MSNRDSIDERNLRSDKTDSHWMLMNPSDSKNPKKENKEIKNRQTDETNELEDIDIDPFLNRSRILRSPVLGSPSHSAEISNTDSPLNEEQRLIQETLNITKRKIDSKLPKTEQFTTPQNPKKAFSINSEEEKSSNGEKSETSDQENKTTTDFKNKNKEQSAHSSNSNIFDWSLSSDFIMANIPIKDITDLIREYNGNEKDLNSFIKNIDKLWGHIATYENVDKARFLLILQLKLTDKAAEATKDSNFNSWENVKRHLLENINPQKNIEKAELKLTTVSQKSGEDLEIYVQRVESLLNDLNKSFGIERQDDIIGLENDRKARRSFENGLNNKYLRNKAIARGSKTFKETVDYVIEQELRQSQLVKIQNFEEKFCSFCKIKGHSFQECRKKTYNRRFTTNSEPKRFTNNSDITCYKCSKKGHYANECRSETNKQKEGPSTSNSGNNNSSRRSFTMQTMNNKQNLNNMKSDSHSQTKQSKNVRFCENNIYLDEAMINEVDSSEKN